MKKIVVMLLALVGLVGFTGCGKTEGDAVKIIDIKLTDEDYAYVVKKGNTALVEDFNAFLTTIKENGKFNEIVTKYFNSDDLEGKNGAKGQLVATTKVFSSFEESTVSI